MEGFLDIIIERLTTIDWHGPAVFVVAAIAFFALLRKWSLLLLLTLTVVIGWGAEDLILLNLETNDEMISVPLLIYGVGGVTIFFLAIFSFFKSD